MALTLGAALEGLGTPYRLDRSGALAHAIFEYGPAGGARRCSATLMGEVLRVTVHDLLEGDPEPERLAKIDRLNRDWVFGRVYFDAARAVFDAAAGLPLFEARARPFALRATLDHLTSAGEALRHYRAPKLVLPQSADITADALGTALELLGITALRSEGRVGFQCPLPGGVDAVIELRPQENLLVVQAAEANPLSVAPDDALYRALQEVNAGLPIGTVTFDPEAGRVFYLLALPRAWYPLDEVSLRFAIAESARVITTLSAERVFAQR